MKFRVREVASAQGYRTAAELARDARMPQATVYALWNNQRSDANYSTLRSIASFLRVEVDDIVEYEGEESPKTAALAA